MSFFTELQEDKIRLVQEFDRLFLTSSLESIAQLPDTIDLFLANALKQLVARRSPAIFGAEPGTGEFSFKARGAQIEVEWAPDVQGEQVLNIALLVRSLDVNPSKRETREIRAPLSVTGTYVAVAFHVPAVLGAFDEELLKALAIETFALGHKWMNERIVTAIRSACEATNRELYGYLRIMVPNDQLLEGFVFSAGAKDADFVVLDDHATQSSMRLAAKRAGEIGRSAASIALQMMLEVVPMSDSAIGDVVQQGDCVEIDLSRGRYYQQEDDGFSDTLRAVWGDTVSCFPVVTTGEFLLVAFFMTKYKGELEPLLHAHREQLQRIAARRKREILMNLKVVSKAREGKVGNWAEVLGRFTGGMIKATTSGP